MTFKDFKKSFSNFDRLLSVCYKHYVTATYTLYICDSEDNIRYSVLNILLS